MKTRQARRVRATGAAAGLLLSSTLAAQAIVDANSVTNTSAPPDGAPWEYVCPVTGGAGTASGIYVGAGWVLTAYHVGPGQVVLGSVTFNYDGQSQRLTNSDASSTDMILFHLDGLPNLPRLTLASTSPAPLSSVDLIACGRISGSAQSPIGNYVGFYWSPGQFKSWGNNTVSPGGVSVINAGLGNVSAFSTDFTAPGPTQSSHEANAAAGDSGGGMFKLSGSTWQLVGMLDAISNLANQPDGTAVYGNRTYAADIATYGSQITAIIEATVPKLTIARMGSNVEVCWPDTGVNFELQATPTLSTPAWASVQTAVAGTNGQFCATVPATGATRFFRLQKQTIGPTKLLFGR